MYPKAFSRRNSGARSSKASTDVIVGVEKRPPDSPTYVLIHEVPAGDWGVTGSVYAPRT
jgi:phenylpyruvate tautomerase PptA (4-oxalocrotonate tautomerase family)